MAEIAPGFKANIPLHITAPLLRDNDVFQRGVELQGALNNSTFTSYDDALEATIDRADELDKQAEAAELHGASVLLSSPTMYRLQSQLNRRTGLYTLVDCIISADEENPFDIPHVSGLFAGFTHKVSTVLSPDDEVVGFNTELHYQVDIHERAISPAAISELMAHAPITDSTLDFVHDIRVIGSHKAVNTLWEKDNPDLHFVLHNLDMLLPLDGDITLGNIRCAALKIRRYLLQNPASDQERDALLDFVQHRVSLYEDRAVLLSAKNIVVERPKNFTTGSVSEIETSIGGLVFARGLTYAGGKALPVRGKNSISIATTLDVEDGPEVTYIPLERLTKLSFKN